MNRLVPFRGSEIFNIDPEELLSDRSIDLKDYIIPETRVGRLGKRLAWIKPLGDWEATLMYAKTTMRFCGSSRRMTLVFWTIG